MEYDALRRLCVGDFAGRRLRNPLAEESGWTGGDKVLVPLGTRWARIDGVLVPLGATAGPCAHRVRGARLRLLPGDGARRGSQTSAASDVPADAREPLRVC